MLTRIPENTKPPPPHIPQERVNTGTDPFPNFSHFGW